MGTSRSRSRQAEVLRTLSLQNRCFEASLTYRFTSNNFTFSAYHCQQFHIFSLSLPSISHFTPLHCQQFHSFSLSLPTSSHFHPITANSFTFSHFHCQQFHMSFPSDSETVHTSKTPIKNAGLDNSFVSRN